MPRVRTSPTTPTISRGAVAPSFTWTRSCLPTGFSPGQKRRAAASLTSATRGAALGVLRRRRAVRPCSGIDERLDVARRHRSHLRVALVRALGPAVDREAAAEAAAGDRRDADGAGRGDAGHLPGRARRSRGRTASATPSTDSVASGRLMTNVSTFAVRNPGSTCVRRSKLRIARPAPASRTSASATWAATSTPRRRRRPPLEPPSRRTSFRNTARSGRDATIAGAVPKTTPATIDSTMLNTRIVGVHLNGGGARQIGRRDRHQRAHAPRSEQQSGGAAGERQHDALGEQLADRGAGGRRRAPRAPRSRPSSSSRARAAGSRR